MLTLIPPDYRTLGPLRPDTTSPPFFLVWLKVSVNSVPSRRSCTRLSSWPAYCNIVWLLLMSLLFRSSQGCPSTIWLVTWTANCHLTGCAEVVGLQTQIFPGSCFSFFRTGCIQTFLVQIHSYVLILPRVLQQLTMGWIPGFNLPTPFHGDHTSFHAYYWEGSGVKCWGENICFALLQKNLVSNHYKAFPGVRPLAGYSFICFFLAASLCLIGSYGISPAGTILSGSFLRSSLPNMSMSGLSFVAGWGVAR